MALRSKGYTPEELSTLKAGVAAKIPFEKLVEQFPGRSPSGLKRKASDLGYLRPAPSTDQSIIQMLKEANSPARARITPDERFQNAMHNAIKAGRESVVAGIIKTACTVSPRMMHGEPLIFIRSSAGLAADLGETVGSSPSDF